MTGRASDMWRVVTPVQVVDIDISKGGNFRAWRLKSNLQFLAHFRVRLAFTHSCHFFSVT